MNRFRITRRRFLQSTVAAAAAPTIIPASALGLQGAVAASERITLGVIGLGTRGLNLLGQFLDEPTAQVVAVCDVDSLHYRDRDWGEGPVMGLRAGRETVSRAYANQKSGAPAAAVLATADFQELCGRDGLDAVVVATPDHWHALCTLAALRAGKDVYCEKPVTHTFREGQAVYREVARQKAVFQTGSQQRSDREFQQAVELVSNGQLGRVRRVEVGLPPGYAEPMGDTQVMLPPKNIDYDRWCGPSVVLPYMRARHHRWWRGHRAYGGGVLMDFIGHHNDIAHWSLGFDRLGPLSVEATDWQFPTTAVYDTPQSYTIRCQYPGEIEIVISSESRKGVKWIGDAGWVFVNRGRLEASDKRWTAPDFDPGPQRMYLSPGHVKNFLECMRTRRQCIAPAETAHRSITPGHLGYVSHQLGRRLRWDAKNEVVLEDPAANRLLQHHDYRAPWTL